MTDRIFYAVAAGFVGGIFVRSFTELGGTFSWLFVMLGAALFILSFIKGEKRIPGASQDLERPFLDAKGVQLRYGVPHFDEGRDLNPLSRGFSTSFTKGGILTAVFLLAAGLGMLRYDFAERNNRQSELELFVHQTVTLEGIIADEPDIRETNTRYVLYITPSLVSPSEEGEKQTEGAKILLTVAHEPRFKYGDRVRVAAKLERPIDFIDEKTLREVDYISHLAKDGIYYEMFRPKLTLLAHGGGNPLVERLFAFKNAFIGNIDAALPQPHAALLGGLVVGAKQSLGKELLDDFRTVGVIHIVVLSGYNITIIARFIEWLFSGLRRNIRLIIAALAMMLFAVMVGASATVIRATIMALLVLLAHGTGRLYAVTRALLIAGAIMLIHNPKILVFDTSFQLSFLATVGLIYFAPLIEPRVKWITARWNMREITVATIATQLFVLPFLLYKTGILSLVSLPVNLLILSAIPLTMLFGFFTGLAGFAWSALAAPFAFLSYALLAYELAVVEWFAELPFAAIALANFPLWLVLLCYGLYFVLFLRFRRQRTMPTDICVSHISGPLTKN